MMAADIRVAGSSIQAGVPHELFDSGYINYTHGLNYQTYAVSADGQRFLVPRPENAAPTDTAPTPITVVLNWTAALKK